MASTALTTIQNTKQDLVQRLEKAVPSLIPSTPANHLRTATTSIPRSESPGQWRHPKLSELARRQKRNSFNNSNVWTIIANVVAVIATWQWRDALSPMYGASTAFLGSAHIRSMPSITSWQYWPHLEWALTLIYFYNMYLAAHPAWRPADNIADVDLTAGQRALLGLDPTATPPETASTRYVTPPRYARSAGSTPLTGSSFGSRAASLGSSGIASRGSSPRSVSGGSPFSASPNLWQRKVHERRRSSLGAIGRSTANSPSPAPAPQVPAYGDRDAWMLRAGGTPPRRDEWRFVTSGSGGSTIAATGGSGTVGGPGTAAGGPAAAASGRNSPLGLSLEGTGLWGASVGSAGLGGSVFRPDTPSPIGRGASVPLTSRWVYERGREEGRF